MDPQLDRLRTGIGPLGRISAVPPRSCPRVPFRCNSRTEQWSAWAQQPRVRIRVRVCDSCFVVLGFRYGPRSKPLPNVFNIAAGAEQPGARAHHLPAGRVHGAAAPGHHRGAGRAVPVRGAPPHAGWLRACAACAYAVPQGDEFLVPKPWTLVPKPRL